MLGNVFEKMVCFKLKNSLNRAIFSGLVTCRKPNVCRGAVQEVLSWSSIER